VRNMARRETPWYKLDNAGTLYSAIQREEYSAIYRFSAWMTDPVDPALLQNAIDRCMPRFPGFAVRIRRGFFWYYFEPNTAPGPYLKPDVADPCQPVRFREDNGYLVRFYYYRNRISFEAFHALADGTGGLVFFRTLLAEYLRLQGHTIPCGSGLLDVSEAPRREEREDAYARYAGEVARAPALIRRAYSNRGEPEPFYTFHVTMGFVPVDQIKSKAREYQASLTEYLAAGLIWVLLEKQHRERPHRERPVALAVPIDLRALFPTDTLRNFILTVQPSVDPALGPYRFADIVSQVHHYMRLHINPQELRALFTRNVRYERNPALQLIPRPLKNPVMAYNYRTRGVRPYSATFTNPGVFRVPPEMEPHIRHMEVVLGQATVARPHVSAISYGNTLEITFAGTQQDAETERAFFHFLITQGIPVRIESNRRPGGSSKEED
jgi:hypothetical protein